MESVIQSFFATLHAFGKVGVIIVFSAWLVRKRVFNEGHVRALSGLVVNLALPCLIFSSIIRNFNLPDYEHWWRFPLGGVLMFLVCYGLARLVFHGEGERRNTLIGLSSLQNAGYLILPIGEVLFPEEFGRFSIYIFLMLLTYNPLLWSAGKILISHKKGMVVRVRDVVTPPFVGTVSAVLISSLGLQRFVPNFALEPIAMVGTSCVPLATVALGLTMGMLHVDKMPSAGIIIKVMSIKLIALPVIMFIALKYLQFSSGYVESAFWILEAAAPQATAMALQSVHYGGDDKLVCGVMVVNYLIALVTLPLFFSLIEVIL